MLSAPKQTGCAGRALPNGQRKAENAAGAKAAAEKAAAVIEAALEAAMLVDDIEATEGFADEWLSK